MIYFRTTQEWHFILYPNSHNYKWDTKNQTKKHATDLHSLRKQQVVSVTRKCYLVLFSLSGMLQKELAALDIFQSNLISKTPTLAGTKDCLLPDCGCWQESCPCCVEHFGPGKKRKKKKRSAWNDSENIKQDKQLFRQYENFKTSK